MMSAVRSALHETTHAPTTGLGKKLAGSKNAADNLWMPLSAPWNPDDAVASSVGQQLMPVETAVAAELERAKQLSKLRAQFRESCQKAAAVTAPPMHAIERWILLSKWHEHSSLEPLLPVGEATAADAALETDLQRAGMTSHEADKSVAALRASTNAAAALIRNTADASGGGAGSSSSSGQPRRPLIQSVSLGNGLSRLTLLASAPTADDGGSNDEDGESDSGCDESFGSEVSVEVTEACVEKLRSLFARGCAGNSFDAASSLDADSSLNATFLARLFVCLLRYKAVGGLGFQAALGGSVFLELQRHLGTNFEAFASPLNCFYGPFCSAFPDVDAPFGSFGSFSAFRPRRGSYQVNPPFVACIIDAAAEHMLTLLRAAQAKAEPLCFAVVLPGWTDCAGYMSLVEAGSLLRRSLLVAAVDHGFIDGGQHSR